MGSWGAAQLCISQGWGLPWGVGRVCFHVTWLLAGLGSLWFFRTRVLCPVWLLGGAPRPVLPDQWLPSEAAKRTVCQQEGRDSLTQHSQGHGIQPSLPRSVSSKKHTGALMSTGWGGEPAVNSKRWGVTGPSGRAANHQKSLTLWPSVHFSLTITHPHTEASGSDRAWRSPHLWPRLVIANHVLRKLQARCVFQNF